MGRTEMMTLALVACFATTAAAAVPGELHYQGYLTDSEGAPVHCPDAESCDDVFTVTFRTYDSAEEGDPLWEETHAAVPIVRGTFDVELGSQEPVDPTYLVDPTWLGLSIRCRCRRRWIRSCVFGSARRPSIGWPSSCRATTFHLRSPAAIRVTEPASRGL